MMTPTDKRRRLRAVFQGSKLISPATVFDALSARVAESVGYEIGLLSGAVSAATLLAMPDLNLHTLTEFAEQVRRITRVSDLSLFVDADQGFGNALNAMRAVEELEHAGLAGLAIEDLAAPLPYGGPAMALVPVEEMTGKLRAALAARRDPSLVIAARTAVLKTGEAATIAARARAYEAAGVDALFITGLKRLEDLDAARTAVGIPIIVGSAPMIRREDLAARGIRFCLQGHPPVAAVVKALHDVYAHLHAGGSPAGFKDRLATPEAMGRIVGEDRYAALRRDFLG